MLFNDSVHTRGADDANLNFGMQPTACGRTGCWPLGRQMGRSMTMASGEHAPSTAAIPVIA